MTGSQRGQRDMNISVYDQHHHRVASVDYSVAFTRHDLRKDGGSIPDRHGVRQTDDYGREWRSGYAREEVAIKMIEVEPDYRRRGLGMALLHAIADSEQLPINSGMQTNDGGKLWKAWVTRPTRLP